MNDAGPAYAPQTDLLAKRRLRMWLRLLRVTRRAEAHLREFLRVNHDTTLPRFDVMAALHRQRQPITMTELSRLLLVSNGNATAVVDRLERDGLVRRTPSGEDRRSVLVALTPRGLESFETLAIDHEAEIDALFAGLDDDDLDALKALVKRMERQTA